MSFILKERCNLDRLNEVINCNNLPIKNNSINYNADNYKKYLKRCNKKGIVKTKYIKKNKEKNFGRYYTDNFSIQLFPKEVRKYISGSYYYDIDMVNAHPVIIYNLFKKYNIQTTFIKDYVEDRDGFIKKSFLRDKNSIFTIINNANLNARYKSTIVRYFHDNLYNWFTKHIYNNNKTFYNQFKKESSDNFMGVCLSWYLHEQENNILMSMLDFFQSKNIKPSILMFDGLMISNTYNINEEILIECEKYIKENIEFDIKLKLKPTETNWIPTFEDENDSDDDDDEKCDYDDDYKMEQSRKLFANAFEEDIDNDGGKKYIKNDIKFNKWMKYMNKYLCLYQRPHTYGFRYNINDNYEFYKSHEIKEIITTVKVNWSISPLCLFSMWNKEDDRLRFIKKDFIIWDKDPDFYNEKIDNIYIRPEYEIVSNDLVMDKCGMIFTYIKEIICNNNIDLYNFTLQYISNMIIYGKTKIAYILMGQMGTGKNTFYYLLKELVGDKYSMLTCDKDRITSRFNSDLQNKIIICLDEVDNDVGNKHSFNSKMKNNISESEQVYEQKNINSMMGKNSTNYMSLTNNFNPANVPEGNRRYVVTHISSKYKQNYNFFKSLVVNYKENIKILRGYFINKGYDPELEFKRPITSSERNLHDMSKSTLDSFVEECLPKLYNNDYSNNFDRLGIILYNNKLSFKEVYNYYIDYKRESGDNSSCSLKYFKQILVEKYNYIVSRCKHINGTILCIYK